MVDFSQITERLFTGAGISTAADVDQLVAAGITHIIDARDDFDDEAIVMASHPFIFYTWNPTPDDGHHPKPSEWFGKAVIIAMGATIAASDAKVYTHCAAGVNRGPSLAYAILRAMGLSKDEAYNMIKAKRPQAGIAYRDDADAALQQLGWTK